MEKTKAEKDTLWKKKASLKKYEQKDRALQNLLIQNSFQALTTFEA